MRIFCKKTFVLQCVALGVGLALLAACDMPTKPEGADVAAMTHLGDQLRTSGDDIGAAEMYQRALQHNPDDVDARKALAQILEAHNDDADAVTQYQEALRVQPENIDLLRAYGRVLIRLGRPEEAKAQFEKALQVDSSDVKSLNGLGIALDYTGNHEAAQKAYREALDDQSDDLVTLSNLGHSYVLTGAYERAIQLLEPHLKDKGVTPAYRQNLAEAYGMAGMDADAERVGLMDLSLDQVKHNIAYYHAQRGKPALTADLGSYATEAMANAQADQVKTVYAHEISGLIVSVNPEVKSIGGTPSFSVRVSGFAKNEKLKAFCDRLKKDGLSCKTH